MERKELLILFDDGERISRREGTLTAEDSFSITIDGKHIIPKARIIRMEVVA